MWKKGQCAPQNTRYTPSILWNNQSLLVLEDILSIVLRSSCPSTALGKELWMLALGFLLFLSPFPFYSFLWKPANVKFWMSRSALPTILHPCSLYNVPCKQLQDWTLDGEMWGKGQCAPQNTRYNSKHPWKQSVSFSSRGYSISSFAQLS